MAKSDMPFSVPANWIIQAKGFWRKQLTHPVSANSCAVWHYLAHVANEAYWTFPLRLSVNEICGALSLSSTSFKRAREELIKYGYLLHFARPGRKSAEYILLSTTDDQPYGTQKPCEGTATKKTRSLSPLVDK